MPSNYSTIRKNIRLDCTHRVFFTKDSFSMANDTLSEILQPHLEGRRTKTLVYLDEGILDGNPNLPERIESYFRAREERLNLVASPLFIHIALIDWAACFCLSDSCLGAFVKVTPSNTKCMFSTHN